MPLDYEVFPTPREAAAAAAQAIERRLASALTARDHATLAISGGSTPKLMFEILREAPLDWRRVHFFWVDERLVPPGHADSNYRLAREALLDPLGVSAGQVHRVEGERSPEEAARRYQDELREFFGLRAAGGKDEGGRNERNEQNALPRFDALHLGMGADAHTASLFPGGEWIGDRQGIAASVYAASRDSRRVTLLPGVLLRAAATIFLVAGADKASTLQQVFQGPYDVARRPVQLFARESPQPRWFLDQAAAEKLSS